MGLLKQLLAALAVTFVAFCSPCWAASHYDTLELPKGRESNPDEIKRAFRRLAMRWHPDQNQGDPEAEKKFKEINEANEVLSDPEKKKYYDQGIPFPDEMNFDPQERPTRGFYDPTGIAGLNNSRLNDLHDGYVGRRGSMSPAEALIETLREERGRSRRRLWGDDVYESQTQYVFSKFINEVLNDLFFAGEGSYNILLGSTNPGQLPANPRSRSVTLLRWPTLEQIAEIEKLHGGSGSWALLDRALREARTEIELNTMFDRNISAYLEFVLDYPDRHGEFRQEAVEQNVSSTRKEMVTRLEAPLIRVFKNANVPEYFTRYLRTRMSWLRLRDRRVAKVICMMLTNMATPASRAALRNIASDPQTLSFVRDLAKAELDRPSTYGMRNIDFHSTRNWYRYDESKALSKMAIPSLTDAQIAELRRLLGQELPTDWREQNDFVIRQFEAAINLYLVGKLFERDLDKVGVAVNNYSWRYNDKLWSQRMIDMLLELAPNNQNVVPLLARAVAEGWGIGSNRIAEAAMKYNLRSQSLIKNFRMAAVERHQSVNLEPTIKALGLLGDASDEKLVGSLIAVMSFKYVNREPSINAYAAAAALARLGVRDHNLIQKMRQMIRDTERNIRGTGVPFAAALVDMGVTDAEVIRVLEREVEPTPNGQREHDKIARDALNRVGSAARQSHECELLALP